MEELVDKELEETERTPRGHDLGLLRELQELTPAERLRRNSQMVELMEKLRLAREHAGTGTDLSRTP